MSAPDSLPGNLLKRIETHGFALLQTSESLRQSISSVFDAGYAFFRASADAKLLNWLPEETGYRAIGREYSDDPNQPDQLESFTVTIRHPTTGLPEEKARVLATRMLDVFHEMEELSETLATGLKKSITCRDDDTVQKGAFHRWSRLQLNYSRPSQVSSQFINEAHEDGNLLTLACASGRGLEVRSPTGEFIPLTAHPGELILMPGGIIWLLSGGRIPPLFHRVVPHTHSQERLALLFFGDISPSVCEPWLETDVNRGIDIRDRVRTNVNRFGLDGFSGE